jgi:hypothetical protein
MHEPPIGCGGMGRVKLKMKKLENVSGRHITYSKRRSGILKKAKELSILCDIHLLLLMFSPSGKPTLCIAERRYERMCHDRRTRRMIVICRELQYVVFRCVVFLFLDVM